MTSLFRRTPFWLAVSAAAGLLLTFAVAGFGGSRSSRSASAAERAVPSAAPLAVFARPRTPLDVIPTQYVGKAVDLSGANAGIAEQLQNGQVEIEKSRRLLADVGSIHADLYALPSAKGLTCSFWVDGAGATGGCGSLTPERPVGMTRFDPDGLGHGIPISIGGPVPNNVTRVEVVIEGKAHDAPVRDNAYFFEAPTATVQPEALRVTFDDGSTTTVPLAPIPAS